MPEEYLAGRTTDPATWLRTPKNLDRLAAYTQAASICRRAMEDRLKPGQPADGIKPTGQQHHQANRSGQGRRAGRNQ
ncbi:hypothetical protein AB0L33_24275 [Streptomyces sp. NPDC052299]|uniref:hypothetical protein n=1 Tax=Streptomyces sp. NPDC052299 TaxID=3155054 RepID=UPI00341A7798